MLIWSSWCYKTTPAFNFRIQKDGKHHFRHNDRVLTLWNEWNGICVWNYASGYVFVSLLDVTQWQYFMIPPFLWNFKKLSKYHHNFPKLLNCNKYFLSFTQEKHNYEFLQSLIYNDKEQWEAKALLLPIFSFILVSVLRLTSLSDSYYSIIF